MKYKTAIIGLGKIGSAYDGGCISAAPRSHVGAILGSKNLQLSGVFDPNPKAVALFKKQWGSGHTIYSSVDALLKNKLDIVVVATSTTEHRSILEKVLAAKPKLIFCEKPFCKNLKEAQSIERKAHSAGIPIIVNYHRRWDPRFEKLEKIFNQYGRPVKVVVTYRKGLLNYGSHAIDFLLRFLGSVERVIPQERKVSTPGKEVDPSVSFGLQFAGGTLAQFIGIDDVQYELFDFDFYFKKHKIQITFGGQELSAFQAVDNLWYEGYTNLESLDVSWQPGLNARGLFPAYEEIVKILSKNLKYESALSAASTLKNAIEVHQVLGQVFLKTGKKK